MVRCADCGFLAVKHPKNRTLCEVELNLREQGKEWPKTPDGLNSLYDTIPICFVRAAKLAEEMHGTGGASFYHVIRRERDCIAFTFWQQGFSPREHKEMLDSKEQRAWQEARHKEDQAFQERMRADERTFQVQQKNSDRRWQFVMVVLGAGLTALGAAIIRMISLVP
jgi:hypothetical protein